MNEADLLAHMPVFFEPLDAVNQDLAQKQEQQLAQEQQQQSRSAHRIV